MATELEQPAERPSPPIKAARKDYLQLVVAIVLTCWVVPVAWSRALVVWILFGTPEAVFAIAFVVASLVVLWLTTRLASGPLSRHYRRIGWLIAGIWTVNAAIGTWITMGDLVPKFYVTLAVVAGSYYLPWMLWMVFVPWRWTARLAVLAGLAALVAPFWIFFEMEGLTGNALINVVWRNWQSPSSATAATLGQVPTNPPDAEPLVPNPGRDFPQFLGPQRTGILEHVQLDRNWNAHPPRELWRRKVGPAWSSFAVVGDFVFTQEQRGDEECVVCYRLPSGEPVWVHADPARFESPMGGLGPRATPTFHEGTLFTLGAAGLLNCLRAETGQRVWSTDILQGDENHYHGTASSPLVEGDRVYVCPTGADGPSLAAYQLRTGRLVWRAGADRHSYSSPIAATLHGVRQILLHNELAMVGHDPDTGKVLWRFPWGNDSPTNASQPIAHAGSANRVFCSTGYGVGSALLDIGHSPPENQWSVAEVWTTTALKTKFCSAILYQDHLYGLDEGILTCLDLATGERRWKRGRYGFGQILLAGDLLLVIAEKGDLVLVEPNPDRLTELARIRALPGKTWNHPALAPPYLLIRNNQEAVCYELPVERE